jgi:D-hydroxyproline dehydrogenase subunit beta
MRATLLFMRCSRGACHHIVMNSRSAMPGVFDLAVVGAGIVGLSCARAAALKGLRVVVIDRDARANGASIRNFGYVSVTGQERGTVWNRARRTCSIWQQVAEEAGIAVLQRGLWMMTRRPEAVPVLEAFQKTEMGEGCEILSRAAAQARCSEFVGKDVQAVMVSPHGLRVDSREAIPKVAAWLSARFGVKFLREATVLSVEPPSLKTSSGIVEAEAVVVCPGDDLTGLFATRIASYQVIRCKLQMQRLAAPGFRLPAVLMSDLGLLRYAGYAMLPQAAALKTRLEAEQREYLEHGIHLIVVQNADGSLIVGDSHHYAATPDPFADERVDRLILEEFAAVTGRPAPAVIERWTGTYSSATDRSMIIDAPAADIRIAMVTSGAGASIGFAMGEEVIADLYGGAATP